MEKSLIEYLLVPIFAVLGYQDRTKVGVKECKAKHDGLCSKMEAMHEDVKYIRQRLDSHLEK